MHKKHYISAVVMIVFLFFALGSSEDDRTPEQIAEDKHRSKEITAFVMSQRFVKDRLISPSTAKFPLARDRYIQYLGENTFIINAYVDSQNAFGAMIRSDYTVKIRYNKQTDVWHLEAIVIQ